MAVSDTGILVTLIVAGLMGLLGQGVRTVVGLKGMADDAKALGVDPNALFQTARLLTSLLIGLLIGLAAGLIYLAGGGASPLTPHTLFGFVAAGYVGTDFLEAFISNYLGPARTTATATAPPAAPPALQGAASNMLMAKLQAPPKEIVISDATRQFVLSVMADLLPHTKMSDDTKLADLGYTDVAIDIIRGAIDARNWRGVRLGFGALNSCAKLSDVMKIVEVAKH
jgi:hypothetical protein